MQRQHLQLQPFHFHQRHRPPKAAMSGRRPPSSLPPQPFRFWLPYGSWRQQPRPPSQSMPSSPRPQPPTPPPPTPAGPPPQRSAAHAVVEDIPLHAESSDESSDTIPIRSSGSSQLRGGRPSAADLELTLSGPPPAGHEQSSGRAGGGNHGGDTKIAISGFPRSRLFDGARAPYRREIEDGLKSLATREAPEAMRPEQQGYRVVTLAGHNVGASMVLGGAAPPPGPGAAETPEAPGGSTAPPRVAANVNSNVQSVNNSSMEGSTLSAGSPGVHVDVKNAREEPAAAAPTPKEEDKPKKEPVRRPPLVATSREEKSAAAAAGGGEAARQPARRRRCLRALMMESGSDTEAARKPRPGACRFQCVADHAPPPATASNGGGAGGDKSAESGGKSSTEEAAS